MNVVMLLHNDMRGDARVMREAETLSSAGYEVTVLCLRGEGLPDIEERDGYSIRRVADAGSATWRQPARKVGENLGRTAKMVAAASELKPDVVHCHDTDTLPAGVQVKQATGVSLVYDAHELFPDMLSGHGRSLPFVQMYWRAIEKRVVPQADAVITVNDSRAGVLRERYGVSAHVVRSVPEVEPLLRTDRLRAELGISSDIAIVLYQGGLIGGRALTRLAAAMRDVDDAVLVFQGAGSEEPAMRSVVESQDLADRVILAGWVRPEELHEYACGADVGVVIYENTSLNNYHAAPNKLYAYLMAGLPMVASDFPGLREIVIGEDVGGVFDPSSAESIAAAMRGLLGEPVRLAQMSDRARELAESRYNWGMESQRLLQAYETLGVGR